jgi:ubiquinone biosynthesis protein
VIARMLVATDRSDTASRAVQWTAEMSGKYAADLLVLQVVAPEHLTAGGTDSTTQAAADDLATFTRQVCGERGRPLLVYDSDPADAIVRVCEQERVDLVVVGNVGMRDRTEFLLGSVPNRVSHNARCSVVIVNTALNGAGATPPKTAQAAAEPSDSQLLGRAAHVARVLTRYGLRDVMCGGKDDEAERARRSRSAPEELGRPWPSSARSCPPVRICCRRRSSRNSLTFKIMSRR